jgi:hypothetical protein
VSSTGVRSVFAFSMRSFEALSLTVWVMHFVRVESLDYLRIPPGGTLGTAEKCARLRRGNGSIIRARRSSLRSCADLRNSCSFNMAVRRPWRGPR